FLEWNVVIQIIIKTRIIRGLILELLRLLLPPGSLRRAAKRSAAAAGTAATRVEHLHLVGNDFGGISILAILALPFARLPPAPHFHLAALPQILPRDLGQAREKHDAVPFGALLHLAALLVAPTIRSGQADIGHRRAAGTVTRFRIGAEI